MTRPEVYREAVRSLRYQGPERRAHPRETPMQTALALLTLILLIEAMAAIVIVAVGYGL